MISPIQIKVQNQTSLFIKWNSDRETLFPLKFLRDESPDAGNKGETILWQHFEPAPQGPDKPGKYEVAGIEQVGNYAIQISWKDGYDHGIYSWDLLLKWADELESAGKSTE